MSTRLTSSRLQDEFRSSWVHDFTSWWIHKDWAQTHEFTSWWVWAQSYTWKAWHLVIQNHVALVTFTFAYGGNKEDKNSIPQCIGQSHITTAFSNMAPSLTSTENVNKLCLFVQETEHLQVKFTMMVCPERMSNVYNFSSFWFSIQEGWASSRKNVDIHCRPEPGKLASAICFNFCWKLRFIWGLRIKIQYFNWINWPDLTRT